MKLIFTMGLPASGKTTWSRKYCKLNNAYHCHFDSYIHNGTYNTLDELVIYESTKAIHGNFLEIVFDHTFYSDEYIMNVLNIIEKLITISSIEIHYWEIDRDKCLKNDNQREINNGYNCKITIKNAKLEYPNLENFKNWEVRIMKHEVLTKKDFIDKYGRNGELKGDKWCLGGTWGNCWGNSGTISAEAQPQSFNEFDDLLLEICPQIGILMYKKLYNSTVSIDEYDDRDYYGGRTEYAQFKCNLCKLYDLLVEYSLL